MGKFDGPQFFREGSGVVSIWVATCCARDVPSDYFTEHYDDDDDAPFSRFADDFGFGFYDHDFVEGSQAPKGDELEVRKLLSGSSWGSSFIEAACAAAERLGVAKSGYVHLMYDFAYDPAVTGTAASDVLLFIGSFPFDKNAEPG